MNNNKFDSNDAALRLAEMRRNVIEALAEAIVLFLTFLWEIRQRFEIEGYKPTKDFRTKNRYQGDDEQLLSADETRQTIPSKLEKIAERARELLDTGFLLAPDARIEELNWMKEEFSTIDFRFRTIELFLKKHKRRVRSESEAQLYNLFDDYCALRAKIINANEGLIRSSVLAQARYTLPEDERNDLFAEAKLWAIDAADRYVPGKGATISTFMSTTIRQKTMTYFSKKYGKRADNVKQQINDNIDKLDDEKIAGKVNRKRRVKGEKIAEISLDAPFKNTNKSGYACIGDVKALSPGEIAERKEQNRKYFQCVEPLLSDDSVLLFLEHHGLEVEKINEETIDCVFDALNTQKGAVSYAEMAVLHAKPFQRPTSPQNIAQKCARGKKKILDALSNVTFGL